MMDQDVVAKIKADSEFVAAARRHEEIGSTVVFQDDGHGGHLAVEGVVNGKRVGPDGICIHQGGGRALSVAQATNYLLETLPNMKKALGK